MILLKIKLKHIIAYYWVKTPVHSPLLSQIVMSEAHKNSCKLYLNINIFKKTTFTIDEEYTYKIY